MSGSHDAGDASADLLVTRPRFPAAGYGDLSRELSVHAGGSDFSRPPRKTGRKSGLSGSGAIGDPDRGSSSSSIASATPASRLPSRSVGAGAHCQVPLGRKACRQGARCERLGVGLGCKDWHTGEELRLRRRQLGPAYLTPSASRALRVRAKAGAERQEPAGAEGAGARSAASGASAAAATLLHPIAHRASLDGAAS